MKALIVTFDKDNGNYVVSRPATAVEAVSYTNEAHLVILLTDATTAKSHPDYQIFLKCVSNSSLYCRPEKQIKTMEFIIGNTLSSIVKSSEFEVPTKVIYDAPIT